MKKKILLLFLSISFAINAQSTYQSWSLDYKTTLKKARKNKKSILIYFSGSDWCAPCKSLEKDFFKSARFLKKSKDLNLLYVDIPRREDVISKNQLAKNKKLMKKFNTRKVFPLVLFLNHRGKVKEKLSGYGMMRDPSYHFKALDAYIK